MSVYDSSKSEHENMVNKAADIRELIWEKFPENKGEMVGCPYSVLCYAYEFIEGSINNIDGLKKKLGIASEALKVCSNYPTMDTTGIAELALAKIGGPDETK